MEVIHGARDDSSPRVGARGLIIGLGLVVALWLATIETYRPGAPKDANAPLSEFSAARTAEMLERLVGESVPRPIGSDASAEARAVIVRRLTELGYDPKIQSGIVVCNRFATCGVPTNVVARIEGSEETANGAFRSDGSGASAVLLNAHYDSVPSGPGASDNGAGVATILEIARILKKGTPLRHSVILLFTEGEEAGLLGAELFVRHHPLARSVKAVVNLEARGTSGASLMFETGSANEWLMDLYAHAVERPLTNSIWYAIYKNMRNSTDFTVFRDAGYQGFNFAFIGGFANYHTPRDDVPHADLRSIQHQGDQALQTILALANSEIVAPEVSDAVFFDVFGRVLVRLSESLVLPLALCVLLFGAAAAAWLVRNGRVRSRELVWASIGLVSSLLVAGGGGVLLLMLVRSLRPAGLPQFVAYPGAFLGTSVALAALVVVTLDMVLRSRATFWALWSANTIWNALAAAVLAAMLPGASYLPLLPAIVGLLAIVLRPRRPSKDAMGREVSVLAYILVMFTLLWPIVAQLYAALGTGSLPLLTFLLVFGMIPVAGVMPDVGASARRVLHGAAVVLVVIGAVLTVTMPVYSADSPQRLNFTYRIDRRHLGDTASARWLLRSDTAHLPPVFKDLMPFRPLSETLSVWEGRDPRVFAADAPLLSLPQPQLAVRSMTTIPDGSSPKQLARYLVRVAPGRPAGAMEVAFSPSAAIQSMSVAPVKSSAETTPVNVHFPPAASSWSVLRLVGLPPDGFDLSFVAANEDFDVILVDKSYGLPPGGQALLEARARSATSSNEGDVSIVAAEVHFSRQADGGAKVELF